MDGKEKKKKIEVGLLIISLVIWIITILTTNIEQIELSQIGGLSQYMPMIFWIGLIILVGVIVSKIFDDNIEKKYFFLIILFLSFYLVWTPYLIEDNPRIPSSYVHFGEARSIFENHYANSEHVFYHQWPGALLFTSEIMYLTNLEDLTLLIILPLIFVLLYYLIFYLILSKIIEKNINKFIGMILFILGNCIGQIHWSVQNLAFFLYMVFLYLIVLLIRREINEKKGFILIGLISIIIIVTHAITPYILIFNLIILGILLNNKKLIYLGSLTLGIYLFWQILIASYALDRIIPLLISKLGDFAQIFTFSDGVGRLSPSSIYNIYRLIIKGIIIGLFFFVGLTSLYIIKKFKTDKETKVKYILLISLLITNVIFGLTLKFGAEIIERVVLFSIIPLVLSVVIIYERKYFYIISIVILVLSTMFFPVMYFNESFESIQTSQLKMREFIYENLDEKDIVVDQLNLIWFYKIKTSVKAFIRAEDFGLNGVINANIFIFDSQSVKMLESYYEGSSELLEDIKNRGLNKIYDNGDGEIYYEK